MKEKLKKYKVLIPWALLVLACLFILYLLFFSNRNNLANSKQEEVIKVVQAVGKLIVLPDEVPTVATVTDLEKLKDQAFFKNAKIGDKVLIYLKAEKAILYDSESNKIIELAPLNTYNNPIIKNSIK